MARFNYAITTDHDDGTAVTPTSLGRWWNKADAMYSLRKRARWSRSSTLWRRTYPRGSWESVSHTSRVRATP